MKENAQQSRKADTTIIFFVANYWDNAACGAYRWLTSSTIKREISHE